MKIKKHQYSEVPRSMMEKPEKLEFESDSIWNLASTALQNFTFCSTTQRVIPLNVTYTEKQRQGFLSL